MQTPPPAPVPLQPVRVLSIPLDVVVTDFLLRHDGHGDYGTHPNTAVLHHDGLPDDAAIAYTRIDYDARPPALLVAVSSAAWEPVAVGAEPTHPMVYDGLTAAWPQDGEGDAGVNRHEH